MNNFFILFILQIVSCAFMSGLIWIIQILHYPAFSYLREDQFGEFHSLHTKKITLIVLPVMLLELVTALLLVVQNFSSYLLGINFFFLLLIWLSTFLVSVPLHNSLTKSMNLQLINRLIQTNWIRTFFWSMRLGILVYFALSHLGVGGQNVDISQ